LFLILTMIVLLVALPLVALMSGRGSARAGTGGRGLGRGNGRVPNNGITWDSKGKHAKYILKNHLAGKADFVDWDAFRPKHLSWIISPTNPHGFYTNDNLRRNFKNTIKRYFDHIDPNNPYDGGFFRCLHRFCFLPVTHLLLLIVLQHRRVY